MLSHQITIRTVPALNNEIRPQDETSTQYFARMILSCAPSVIWFRSTSWKSAIPGDLISQRSNEMNQPSAVKHKLSVIHKKKPNKRARQSLQYLPVQSFTCKIKLSMKSIFSFSVQQINLKQEKKNFMMQATFLYFSKRTLSTSVSKRIPLNH